ncbi:uncharacterized protein BCR38DRAFT_434889 [Pseudomassariella vexata]|uniref:Post-SET domain-containing protein n=1 Tax=Pseudomassariella vexata TaxID=1141098 RepID=A0A1Y2DYP4_9PEZI|nr:uncharacterized protein BCR38DRAFT_434889 [Pseudomassariella vexata]ORY64357.1 hypothetical protein BCR38DRAFT_434889 [Pseudomassariella vexata]
MAPLQPHWDQPSHPDVQEVIINEHEFTSKSLSRISLPPFGLYAKMSFPPCTLAEKPTYATVQCGRDSHLSLNSDLLYINHSCEPSLIFDTSNFNIIAGPNGLQQGEELTFFYPSTEWEMAQPFDCLCGKPTCRGRISGAKDMAQNQLEGLWLNGHIRELLEEKSWAKGASDGGNLSGNGSAPPIEIPDDATAKALKDALKHAEMVVEAARVALNSYLQSSQEIVFGNGGRKNGFDQTSNRTTIETGSADFASHAGLVSGGVRRGPTSRELSGEMGGDTIAA